MPRLTKAQKSESIQRHLRKFPDLENLQIARLVNRELKKNEVTAEIVAAERQKLAVEAAKPPPTLNLSWAEYEDGEILLGVHGHLLGPTGIAVRLNLNGDHSLADRLISVLQTWKAREIVSGT